MQLITAALKEEPNEMREAYAAYKAKVKNYNERESKQQSNDNEQIQGQMEIEMELVETKPQEMTDQVKLMRFQAAQVDKLVLKLDHINDTLSMILRAVRKE